jgi:hypothetical protein
MATMTPIISWQTEEYVHREKNPDWFWALGLITLTRAAITVIYHDTLFAIFIVLGATILGYYAARIPDIITISINEEGIKIKEYVYPFKKLKGFAVEEHQLGNLLLIESDRLITPIIAIPLPSSIDPNELVQILKPKLPQQEIKEHPSHRIMEHIGF